MNYYIKILYRNAFRDDINFDCLLRIINLHYMIAFGRITDLKEYIEQQHNLRAEYYMFENLLDTDLYIVKLIATTALNKVILDRANNAIDTCYGAAKEWALDIK